MCWEVPLQSLDCCRAGHMEMLITAEWSAKLTALVGCEMEMCSEG